MANVTITSPRSGFQGTIAGIKFTNGVATADDTTEKGRALIAFAQRQGWRNGSNAAVRESVDAGLPVPAWNRAEMEAYLDAADVTYPADASDADLRAAIQTAYETRAQGGSAAFPAAGHTEGTFPVLGAPNVTGDDDAKAAKWEVPVISSAEGGTAPTITTQPSNVSPADGAAASFTVAGAGVPNPAIQWQKKDSAASTYTNIADATDDTYTIESVSAADRGDRYRAVLTNGAGTVTSSPAEVLAAA